MNYLITDKDLLDYVSGNMDTERRKQFERRAVQTGQSDLLLYVQLADYAATGTSTDDIIGEDVFMTGDIFTTNTSCGHLHLKAAEKAYPKDKNKK